MKLTQITNRKWFFPLCAFLIPFLGMLGVMIANQCTPFGNNSMLYSDMFHQYFPFFKAFRRALLSGDSLLYTWDVGMGLDHVGLYAYYLASPLNLLSVLVPEKWILVYFSLLVPIKLGLASLFFCIFLKKVFNKFDISTVLFGSFYGLCAWALGYQWNVMWLDTFALLPLVITGMVSLLKEGKFVLYTVTLFLSVLINYYIGLFTCIFVFLVFICYQICRWTNFTTFLKDLGRIAAFSLLAIGMTAILSLPTLAALQTTQSSINKFPTTFWLNITNKHNWKGLLEAMVYVAGNTAGGVTPTFKEGLPNLYCGVLTIILSILYFFCKQIRLRDKLCAFFLLLFFSLSFILRQLDYIWHGFHFPNMIPYRFSFLFSYVMLYMAYSAWVKRKQFKLWHIVVSILFALAVLLCNKGCTEKIFIIYNGILLILYAPILIVRYAFKKPPVDEEERQAFIQKRTARKKLCSSLLLGVIALELVMALTNFAVRFSYTGISNYPKGTTAAENVISHMQELEKDTLFYRAEVTHTQTLNDGALNGYRGISTFTSSANVKVTEFMKALGYGAKNTYNRYAYEESSPVADLFLGIKYMIERSGDVEENPYYDDVYSVGTICLLENNAYLPLGFMTNSQLLNVDFSKEVNPFVFQNELMENAAGLEQNVWSILPGTALTINADGPVITPKPTTGYCGYTTDSETTGAITYSYTADREGFMCVYLDLSMRNSFTVFINGERLYSETYSLPQMASVCKVANGDVVDIMLNCNANEEGTIKISSAILDESLFRQAHSKLSASTLELTHFSNTCVEGTVDCKQDGVLYTSIPQNGNWYAYVDDKPVETVVIGDAMVGLLLPEGNHTVRFVYHNRAFALGWKVSLACLAIFVGVLVYTNRSFFRPKKGKYEK